MSGLPERELRNTTGGEKMRRAMRITNGCTLAVVAMALGFACTSVNAETIAAQTFNDDQNFYIAGQTSWTDGLGDLRIT